MSTKQPVLPPDQRFEFIDDEELEAKIQGLKNRNTTKADTKFVTYLEEVFE